jgi:hypothetical protein
MAKRLRDIHGFDSTISRARVPAFVLALSFVLLERPAIAQPSSTLEHISLPSVHHYVAGEATPRLIALPPNLVVSPMYRRLVESMLQDSPTFRRQCVRIASEPRLIVHLNVIPPARRLYHRAMTRMARNPLGWVTAVVDIGALENKQELIAHEFEHIIEQLDGVDLPARAAFAHTGVSAIGHGEAVFETTRAQRMGAKVLFELRR